MPGTFLGVEIARRALSAQQRAVDITGHNIANANTKGYSRQVASLKATDGYTLAGFDRPTAAGLIGTGVDLDSIERMRDGFVDLQIRKESLAQGRWEARQKALEQVELIVAEPSESGLRAALDGFWQSLEDLAQTPESDAARSVVRQQAVALTDLFRSTYGQLDELRSSVDQDIRTKVGEINVLASQVAALNVQITKAESMGNQANDLKDQRDLAINKLSKMVNLTVGAGPMGTVSLSIQGATLVELGTFRAMRAEPDAANNGMVRVTWETSGADVGLTGGELKGLLEIRDGDLGRYMADLNTLASGLATEINTVHRAGYGLDGLSNRDFFAANDGSATIDAHNIAVSPGVAANPQWIAAASVANAPGDGSNALKMAAKLDEKVLSSNTIGLRDFYGSLISSIGVDANQASDMARNQTTLVDHLEQLGQSVSGVSLDEEMTNLIRYQQGYQAAARVMNTMDEMLDLMVNRLGLAGR